MKKIVCEISGTGYDNKSIAGLEQKTDRAEKSNLYCRRFSDASPNIRRNIIISWIYKNELLQQWCRSVSTN